MEKPSLGITVCHHSASLVMPNCYPRDWFFYPTLTLMIDSYMVSCVTVAAECAAIIYLSFIIEPWHVISNNVAFWHMSRDMWFPTMWHFDIWAVTCDFQQCGILTYEPWHVTSNNVAFWHMSRDMWFPTIWHFDKCRLRRACLALFKLRNSKWCSVSSLAVIEYPSDKQRLWSDCAYAQAGLSLCWSHIPHCWKSYATDHL